MLVQTNWRVTGQRLQTRAGGENFRGPERLTRKDQVRITDALEAAASANYRVTQNFSSLLADQVHGVNQSGDHQRSGQDIQPVSQHAPFAGADPVLIVLHLLFEAVKHQDLLATRGN